MFSSQTVTIVVLLAGAWLLQLVLSIYQMKRFNNHQRALRRIGDYVAVGLAGNTYRRKVYAAVAVDKEGVVRAGEALGGFTVFSSPKPIDGIAGLHIDDLGRGEPPPRVSAKTWQALEHAATFVRPKLAAQPLAGE